MSESGGSAPISGRHSTIDRPDSVNRVIAPISIMAITMAQQANSHSVIAEDSSRGRKTAPSLDRASEDSSLRFDMTAIFGGPSEFASGQFAATGWA